MRVFSSYYRFDFSKLFGGKSRNDLKKSLQKLFKINSRYCNDTIFKAQFLINSCIERGQKPKKVIFAGRNLFERLKKGRLNGEQKENFYQINLLKSFYSEPQTQQSGRRGKEQMRGHSNSGYKLWRVVRVAITIPILGKFLVRDLSPLKPVVVEGEWDRVVKR